MFYTETISSPIEKPSLFDRIINTFEKIGYLRAEAELRRLGYHKEALSVRRQLGSLK